MDDITDTLVERAAEKIARDHRNLIKKKDRSAEDPAINIYIGSVHLCDRRISGRAIYRSNAQQPELSGLTAPIPGYAGTSKQSDRHNQDKVSPFPSWVPEPLYPY